MKYAALADSVSHEQRPAGRLTVACDDMGPTATSPVGPGGLSRPACMSTMPPRRLRRRDPGTGGRRRSGRLAYAHRREMGGVEHREEAQQMGGVVYRHTVDGQHVVRVVAALYVQSGIILAASLYAGQHLGVVQRVGVAQYARHAAHEAHAHHAHAPVRRQLRSHPAARHANLAQLAG